METRDGSAIRVEAREGKVIEVEAELTQLPFFSIIRAKQCAPAAV